MVFGLCLAWPADRKARRALEDGRRVRGAEMVTRDEFNQKRKYGYGIGFKTLEKPSLREKFFIKYPYGPMIAIPQWDEAKHFLLMGDTGSGKSALMRQILWQLTIQQQTAIVYDPAREYIERFFNPERGDIILNPLDARSPYWNPGDELDHEAEARTIAESVFPDQPHEPPFFTQTPRKIFAAMLRAGMDAGQMVETMCDGDALNRLVEGTEMASMISQAAPSQREGVRASLNLVADALRLLKTKEEATTTWTAREWATKRTGWIFLTSTPELRAPLQPLLSVWLDLLVLRLMNTESGPARPVWFLFDELGSLQKLPRALSTALTENRKSNNPVVIGLQGKSQVETLYGHLAEAMLSQPWTKIFLKTSEPRAAKWVSDAIGEQDREWLRESRTSGMHWGQQGRDSRTYLVEKKTIPLVLPSQISGLPELHGYAENQTQDPGCPVFEFKPVIWQHSKIEQLPTYGGDPVGAALAINDLGQAVGISGPCAAFNPDLGLYLVDSHALLWEDGRVTDLGSLGGTDGLFGGNHACAINNLGEVVGHSDLTGYTTFHAYIWTRQTGKMTDLGTLPGDFASLALSINDGGKVVGASFDANFNSRAVIWRKGAIADLNTLVPASSGLQLQQAKSINASGQITGFGVNGAGEIHGFLATPR